MVNRLVVFADRRVSFALPMARAALEAAPVAGIPVVALVDATAALPLTPARIARHLGGTLLRTLRVLPCADAAPNASLPRLARRHGVRLVVPPGRDINHPDLQRTLVHDLGATLALSVGCLQIFRRPLLDAFAAAVNYHDGRLPHYRGVGATGWSVYRGEATSGFTFHHMVDGIDEGPILLEGRVPIAADQTAREVKRAKTVAAAAVLARVLTHMAARDPGRPQPPGGEYFSRRRLREITHVHEPHRVAWPDLVARLRAFGALRLSLGGAWWDVTEIARCDRNGGPLAFVTCDEVTGRPMRCLDLPVPLYRLARPLLQRSRGERRRR